MKTFSMSHQFFNSEPNVFTEETAPLWLKEGGVKGSTADMRWFWKLVLSLEIGSKIDTDFRTITRTI